MTYKKQKMMNADVLTFSQGSLSGSGYLENDSSESQCCSQKALLLFHHSFVDHYLEAYVCSVKQHWKDDVLKSYNSSSEAIYLIGHRDFSPCERMLNQKRAQLRGLSFKSCFFITISCPDTRFHLPTFTAHLGFGGLRKRHESK